MRGFYLPKAQWLKQTDLLLAISESSRREAIEILQIPEDRVVNISTGIEEEFRVLEISNAEKAAMLNKYGVTKPYIMYSGAIEIRKNLDGLIRAFALLPSHLREGYQLLIVGKNDADARKRLQKELRQQGLPDNTLLFSGFVSNSDLVALYNLCSLFVLPSLHEGFGLPILEAMACGAPALGSNTTSLPEVIGWDEAMFNPHDPAQIAQKIEQALGNNSFREKLREHSLQQCKKFNWEQSAERAWEAFEALTVQKPRRQSSQTQNAAAARPKLAYFSPLPPVKSGIAAYSTELLPELARYYEIEVIVDQASITDDWIALNFPSRSFSSFEKHASEYNRILYQVGNSTAHIYMFDAIRRYPGVVVMHDFFLSGILEWMAFSNGSPDQFSQAIFQSHGYLGLLQERQFGRKWAVENLPCSRGVTEEAAGVIVHSDFSRRLADRWYGSGTGSTWAMIPLLRKAGIHDRAAARERLGIGTDDFLVCSFGAVHPTKLNDRILSGWLNSVLGSDKRCRLIFVGENLGEEWGQRLVSRIESSSATGNIRITGYSSPEDYRDYLASADCAVQLRQRTRGETSLGLLDCLGSGIATIINSHGSLAEIPDDAAYKLPDEFTDGQLSDALDELYLNAEKRCSLSEAAHSFVKLQHHPARVAELYRDAIESFAISHPIATEQRLVAGLASMASRVTPSHGDIVLAAKAIASNRRSGDRQLLLDVSATATNDLKTGIERVARNVTLELIKRPAGWQVEPIRSVAGKRLYARKFGLNLLGAELSWEEPEIALRTGDLYLALDWNPETVVNDPQFFAQLRALNIPSYFTIYDLLPILQPEKFPDWAAADFRRWLKSVCEQGDGVICISRSVADELLAWFDAEQPNRERPFQVGYFHLGADITHDSATNSDTNAKFPAKNLPLMAALKSRPSLLMVGTLEPRKGHMQALDAFELLWAEGVEANLVLIGHQGWHVEHLVNRLTRHKLADKFLFWLSQADDQLLSLVYEEASGLLAASEGEGFGLPLVEAAKHGLPIVARDLPVFREVAGEHAYYFRGDTAKSLKEAVRSWLDLYAQGNAPSSRGIKWLTWEESAQQLMECITGGKFYQEWRPKGGIRSPHSTQSSSLRSKTADEVAVE